jgi:uncharacterized membrane protein YqhA
MKIVFKIILGVPILTTFFIALIFLGLGVFEAGMGLTGILKGLANTEERPGLMLFQVLDLFLIGCLFFIFSIGFFQLFYPQPSRMTKNMNDLTPKWLQVESFTQLKLILWDTVLTTLVVVFIGDVFRAAGEYTWSLTIIPIAIFLISLGKFLIKNVKKQ